MEEKDAQIIIALSFGQGINNTPGKSNEALAHIVVHLHEKYGLPIIAQWEIADCIPKVMQGGKNLVVREHRQKGQYLDTFEVLAQAKEHSDKFGFITAIIVAHPDHSARCLAVAKKLGFSVVIIDTKTVPYDPESVQEWTQSAKVFLPREEKVIEYYRQKGYL